MNRVVFILVAFMAVILSACGTSNRLAKAEREAQVARQVEEAPGRNAATCEFRL